MGVENPSIEVGIERNSKVKAELTQRSKIDLVEAKDPLIEANGFNGTCSNSGNGCTGSCNHSSK